MRKLILFVAILCAGSASATDYAQCEAMQKTLGRVEVSMNEDVGIKMKPFVAEVYARTCGPMPDLGAGATDKEIGIFKNCIEALMEGKMSKEDEIRSLSLLKIYQEPYQKKIKKINADYKKAGCI